MSDDTILWSKNGWRGYVTEYRGTPHGLFNLRCQKVSRVIFVQKLSADQIEAFDPDKYWEQGK